MTKPYGHGLLWVRDPIRTKEPGSRALAWTGMMWDWQSLEFLWPFGKEIMVQRQRAGCLDSSFCLAIIVHGFDLIKGQAVLKIPSLLNG